MPGGGQRGAVRTEDRFVGGKPGHRSRSLGPVNRLPSIARRGCCRSTRCAPWPCSPSSACSTGSSCTTRAPRSTWTPTGSCRASSTVWTASAGLRCCTPGGGTSWPPAAAGARLVGDVRRVQAVPRGDRDRVGGRWPGHLVRVPGLHLGASGSSSAGWSSCWCGVSSCAASARSWSRRRCLLGRDAVGRAPGQRGLLGGHLFRRSAGCWRRGLWRGLILADIPPGRLAHWRSERCADRDLRFRGWRSHRSAGDHGPVAERESALRGGHGQRPVRSQTAGGSPRPHARLHRFAGGGGGEDAGDRVQHRLVRLLAGRASATDPGGGSDVTARGGHHPQLPDRDVRCWDDQLRAYDDAFTAARTSS